MCYWDDEETGVMSACLSLLSQTEKKANLFESSAIPAKALYQAKNAASSAKKPPALMIGGFGAPMASRCR